MKKLSFLTLALAVMTFSSCSKKDSVDNTHARDAKISISFVDKVDTRVATDAVDSEDTAINDASIFVFQADGSYDVPRSFQASVTSGSAVTINATTNAKNVYVVANIGDAAAHSAMFLGVTNEASLKAVVKDRITNLYSMNNTIGETDIRAKDVLMTGTGVVSEFTNKSATAAVQLAFPLSKIKVIVKDNRHNNSLPTEVVSTDKTAIVDNYVMLINAGSKVKFFSEATGDQAAQSDFYTGDGAYPGAYFQNVAGIWENSDNTGGNGSTNTVVSHHFYTASNNGAISPTILTIKSTKTTWSGRSAEETPTYYPIQFTIEDAGVTLEPAKSYTVTLTLKGDVGGGNGGGVVDPEIPVINGDIAVTITTAAWTPITVDKEFN